MTGTGQLVVTATRREADAVLRDLGPRQQDRVGHYDVCVAGGVTVVAAGIGLAEAAAATAWILALRPADAVYSIGVAGGYGLALRSVAVGMSVTRADTGIELGDGTVVTTREAIGIGGSTRLVASPSVEALAARMPGAVRAHVLTVATVTGTAQRAERVLARAPAAGPVVEDMEAWGVLTATPRTVPCFAVKAVSNTIGPRDRTRWDLDGALEALTHSAYQLFGQRS